MKRTDAILIIKNNIIQSIRYYKMKGATKYEKKFRSKTNAISNACVDYRHIR